MRRLLCQRCGADKIDGTRKVLEGTAFEPAEYERVQWGFALMPTAEQRTMRVNGEPVPLSRGEYTCDDCNSSIKPGERCCAWTVWVQRQQIPPLWEKEFIEVPA